eukprot:TRINITY_DN3881_c0_g1_i1.p1 TRINITY_DN3881_c0_g1~~TRINITY_DN3881_c0_g1_i1.p1  ORF type:complete len:462 (-),score=85.59 TRINITY_DN3881_c0_g1_i1:609-1994(-)
MQSFVVIGSFAAVLGPEAAWQELRQPIAALVSDEGDADSDRVAATRDADDAVPDAEMTEAVVLDQGSLAAITRAAKASKYQWRLSPFTSVSLAPTTWFTVEMVVDLFDMYSRSWARAVDPRVPRCIFEVTNGHPGATCVLGRCLHDRATTYGYRTISWGDLCEVIGGPALVAELRSYASTWRLVQYLQLKHFQFLMKMLREIELFEANADACERVTYTPDESEMPLAAYCAAEGLIGFYIHNRSRFFFSFPFARTLVLHQWFTRFATMPIPLSPPPIVPSHLSRHGVVDLREMALQLVLCMPPGYLQTHKKQSGKASEVSTSECEQGAAVPAGCATTWLRKSKPGVVVSTEAVCGVRKRVDVSFRWASLPNRHRDLLEFAASVSPSSAREHIVCTKEYMHAHSALNRGCKALRMFFYVGIPQTLVFDADIPVMHVCHSADFMSVTVFNSEGARGTVYTLNK